MPSETGTKYPRQPSPENRPKIQATASAHRGSSTTEWVAP